MRVKNMTNLKKKYPIGVPALEKYYSYDDGKNSVDLSIEEVVEREEEIKNFKFMQGRRLFTLIGNKPRLILILNVAN